MKREIQVMDQLTEILKSVSKGVLLTTKVDDKVNTMTISWGTIGIEWNRLLFTAFVRESRFSYEQLKRNGEFTINIPVGEFDKSIIGFCGNKSGRDTDKINELGLTLVEGEKVSVPGIKELPLTLECKVIYVQKQDIAAMTQEVVAASYPADENGNVDMHTVFCGEIVNAYVVE